MYNFVIRTILLFTYLVNIILSFVIFGEQFLIIINLSRITICSMNSTVLLLFVLLKRSRYVFYLLLSKSKLYQPFGSCEIDRSRKIKIDYLKNASIQ